MKRIRTNRLETEALVIKVGLCILRVILVVFNELADFARHYLPKIKGLLIGLTKI
jgi:hypothetical protein